MEVTDRRTAPRPHALAARFSVPVLLLVGEYLAISVLVDLPTGGAARPLADAVRVLVPVLLGAGAAAAILGGRGLVTRGAALAATLPPWRPWPMLGVQLAAFAALAASARALLGAGASEADPRLLAAWLAGAAAAGLLGVAVAVPLRWLGRVLWAGAALPAAALGCGLLAWRVATAAEASWGALSGPTLHGISALFALVGVAADVYVPDRVIGVGEFYVQIAPICSGADGVGLVLVFQGLWLALRRHQLRLGRALLLLPLGAATAFAANVVRLAALILLGASGAEDVAIGGFHSKAGWILFLGVALGSVAVAERWRWLHRDAPAHEPESAPHLPEHAVAHLAPLLAMLAAALVSGAFAAGPFDPLYVLRVVAGVGALVAVRGALPRPAVGPGFAPVAIGAAVAVVWCLFPGGDGTALQAALRALSPAEQAVWLGARLVGSVLVVPVVEELAFRGFLLPWLTGPDPASAAPSRGAPAWSWAAVLFSSAAFGALHGNFLLGAASGVVFAYARMRRGRLSDAVIAHAVANAGVALAVLALGRWDLWA